MKCVRCGQSMTEAYAYNITKWFNGAPSVETVCLDCIKKIGREENGTQNNNSDMSDVGGSDTN